MKIQEYLNMREVQLLKLSKTYKQNVELLNEPFEMIFDDVDRRTKSAIIKAKKLLHESNKNIVIAMAHLEDEIKATKPYLVKCIMLK